MLGGPNPKHNSPSTGALAIPTVLLWVHAVERQKTQFSHESNMQPSNDSGVKLSALLFALFIFSSSCRSLERFCIKFFNSVSKFSILRAASSGLFLTKAFACLKTGNSRYAERDGLIRAPGAGLALARKGGSLCGVDSDSNFSTIKIASLRDWLGNLN